MKLHVAYDEHGKILGAVEPGPNGDRIAAKPGITVAEFDLPTKYEKAKLKDFIHHLHVDVNSKRLIEKS